MPEMARSASTGDFKPTNSATSDFLEGKEGKLADSSVSSDCETKEWGLVEFKVSPKMSTYLVAWAVGRFE
jgi:hypothetical protein